MFRQYVLLVVTLLLFGVALVQAQDTSYVVQPGDTITSIATQFNVSADAILVRNGIISANYITAGQTLIIPTGAVTLPNTYVVQPNDNLTSVAQRFNTTVEALRATNNIPVGVNITVGQILTLPAVGGAFALQTYPQNYVVDTRETLRTIATKFGTTWQTLAAYNNIANPNYIQAGMMLVIPPIGYVPPTPTATPATGGPVTAQPPVTVPQTPVVIQPTVVRYVVKVGDTLNQIAANYGVTLQSITALNNISDVRAIQPGQVLTIPPRATGGPVTQPAPVVVGTYYTVQMGDTMFAIAARTGRNVYSIAQANGILDLNSIYVGQRLFIP